MPLESANSEFSSLSYAKNTKVCSNGVVPPKIIQVTTCMATCSMMDSEFDKVVKIRIVALSLSFPMVGDGYFSDLYFGKYKKNTE